MIEIRDTRSGRKMAETNEIDGDLAVGSFLMLDMGSPTTKIGVFEWPIVHVEEIPGVLWFADKTIVWVDAGAQNRITMRCRRTP